MSGQSHLLRRRELFKLGGAGGLALAGTGLAMRQIAAELADAAAPSPVELRLGATDGHILLPGRGPLFTFGFVAMPLSLTVSQAVAQFKGKAQFPAPTLAFDQEVDVKLTLTNLGMVVRPDLADSHTVHWHGFRNPLSVFDGVPEVSVAVPPNRNFTYFYRPHDPGTYMYHCHFEDVEHVQMGMQGNLFVRPAQNKGAGSIPAGKYAYNDGDRSTEYDREFALLLDDLDTRPHDGSEAIQEFIWTDYKPNYWTINGRAYPDTIKHNGDSSLPSQPLSSLIQVNAGNRVLLRFANLGYEQHSMQLAGIPLHVIAEDATLLRGPGGADLSYRTNSIYIGPGEARDVLFTAPAYQAGAPGGTGSRGPYNTYLLKNRNAFATTNDGAPGLGGMVTEVRIHRDPLPIQTSANQTYA
jgi:FtsP/CotA-like multicopper oxidase with cupredoxin domain